MTQILGHNYIGGQRSAEGNIIVKSVDAVSGETLAYEFHQATLQEVDRAAAAAASAYPAFRALSAERRAEFLEAIADELDALGDEIEEPFGTQSNDLPLDSMVRMIEIELLGTLGKPTPPPIQAQDNNLL